jgi:hypothetical protein
MTTEKNDDASALRLCDGLDDRVSIRLSLGEAWMYCEDCGAKLYSFDGDKDASQKCSKVRRYGKCE